MIVQVSIAYLLSAAQATDQEAVDALPLTRYAAQYWMDHAAVAEEGEEEEEEEEEDIWPWIEKLSTTQVAYKYWLCNFDPDRPRKEAPGSMSPKRPALPLYYLCLGGVLNSAKKLLSQGSDVNAQGGEHGSALQVASFKGRIEIAQMLIEKGADVNAHGGVHGSALQAALFKGHTELAQILIEKGAEVNAQGGRYGNALQAASDRGRLELAQILIEKGAEVNAQWGRYSSALQAALSGGRTELAQMLMEKGADSRRVRADVDA